MRRITATLALLAAILPMLLASPASAQATRTWISGTGADTNPCSRTAPCKTFAGAIALTAAGGEIDTLDPGGFGAVTVTKAMTLADEGVGEAGILVAGTNGITVNCTTDPNCVVVIRGLVIDGGPIGSNSLNGIRFVAGRSLVIENCTIRNFTGGSPNGYGVQFNPSAAQITNLIIKNSSFVTNGPQGGLGGGIFVQPSGAGTVKVDITNVVASNNGGGFGADSSYMTAPGSIQVSISDSSFQSNENGGIALISGASNVPVIGDINHAIVTSNNVGLNGKGSAVTFRIGNSTIANNATGIKNTAGSMTSYGTNQIHDNPIPGPTLIVAGPT
ncbi:MAG TPA: hypothetical protein VGG10_05335 [Rhizomicrobium sp.]|jgi:hypothetical protein